MVEITQTKHFVQRDHWRQWLKKHHSTNKELWLIFYKKHTKKKGLPYDHAVEEALCFGWIDGIMKRVDEEKYVLRFSPRRKRSIWSESNKKRVSKMISEGKMTPAGKVLVEQAKESGEWDKASSREIPEVPPDLKKALAENPKAEENFNNFAPSSYKKQYLWWIETAKREETRERRIQEVVKRAEQNRKPGIE